jgi:UDP-N-acetyl-D-mannosaminuronic acid dehydrogenase
MEDIVSRIRNRTIKVAILGLGSVGLPMATVIAEAGFQVTGVDLNSKIVRAVSEGNISMNIPGFTDLIRRISKKGFLKATLNGSLAVRKAGIIMVCIPTPTMKDKMPNLSYIEHACSTITRNLSEGKLIIFESTLPPKTTKTIIAPMLEEGSGLRCGINFFLAYCPERMIIGNALNGITENSRIVGGYNRESAEVAAEFFKTFAKGEIMITDAPTAEVAKLAENTYRDVNIAFANELALLCEQQGVDVIETIKLANTHPRVNIHVPGPGVGGPCLPKDPYLLLHSLKPIDHDIIRIARKINDYMPKHIVRLILQALRNTGKDVQNSKIVILGTAYKNDVDDSRLSPSRSIIHELVHQGAEITVFDPYCNESFGVKRANFLYEAVKGADCLVVVTDHTEFKNLNLKEIKALMNKKPTIADGRRIINPHEAKDLGFIYYGVGFPLHTTQKPVK